MTFFTFSICKGFKNIKKYYNILMTNKYLTYQLIFLYLIKKRIELKKKRFIS